jgi:hypothetical protein
MNPTLHLVLTLAHNEVRLRMRRLSTVVALLAVVAISWSMIADPAGGMSLLVVDGARVLYTSSALAVGSAALGGMLFGLGGFYLVRGRVSEDIRSGIGSVIGATPVSNSLFLVARWVGGVAYLVSLIVAFLGTMLVCHLVRGDGPIQIEVYLQTYAVLLLPCAFWVVSCAILFDSVSALMGKAGDVLYFFLWVAQLMLMTQMETTTASHVSNLMSFDFTGIAMSMVSLQVHLNSKGIGVGASEFNAALAPLLLPRYLWTAHLIGLRGISAVLALLPLLPAALLFHRFSPDRVKVSRARERRSPLTVLNGLLRPLARLVQPLFALAQRSPGVAGQVMADVALTLVASPSAILALLVLVPASMVVQYDVLAGLLMGAVAFWGILVSDISCRDHAAAIGDMTGAVSGGTGQRYVRQYAASAMLGLMFMGPIALRFAGTQPVRAMAVVAGVLSLSAFASLLGRTSNTSRTFVALFMFGLYVAINAGKLPMLDVVGFNGSATAASSMTLLAAGAAALLVGFAWNRYQAR